MSEVLNPIRSDTSALPNIVASLKAHLGVKLVKLILNVDGPTLNKWINGTATPLDNQKRLIYATGYVVDILRAYLTNNELKLWLISHSEYLCGIPAMEIRSRPEDVQHAALNRISRGEYYELLNDRLQDTPESNTPSRG